jgi:hypothetical protein
MCWVVHATKMTGSSLDDWIYKHLGYTFTLNYAYIQVTQRSRWFTYHLQTSVAHTLGFPVSTSRLLATALNTEIITVSQFKYYT